MIIGYLEESDYIRPDDVSERVVLKRGAEGEKKELSPSHCSRNGRSSSART